MCIKVTEEIKLVDWNTWGNDKPPEEDEEEKEIPAEELFKDMEPVINKAKMVCMILKMLLTPGSICIIFGDISF